MRQGRHPGIVRLEATYLSADPPCLQYEYVQGGDLGGLILDWHRQEEKITPEQVARSLLQLAEIVGFAHRLDPPIVHRGLKPANILVRRSKGGEVAFAITDFGIGGIATARAVQASRVPTSPSQFLTTAVRGSGTLLHSSPEQLSGNDPDPRDDVHALGVIWYQMLIGELTRGHPGGTAWRRRFLDRGMPAAMRELLESCFEDQEDRPADAAVLAERLAALLKRSVDAVKQGKEIVNSIGMKLKLVPAGEFLMGSPDSDPDAYASEKPQHHVRITKPFYLGIHQVTRGQFRRFVEASGYKTEAERDGQGAFGWDAAANEWVTDRKFTWRSPGFDQTDDHPVVNVSWNDAKAFCDWLSQQEGQTYRLPTEAEWEYACRAGTTTRYSFGDDESVLDRFAWYGANSNRQTHPVGEKKPNAFDLHDMHGNVWEWCWDGYDADYYKQLQADDPQGPPQAARRVIRGGSWEHDPRSCWSANRYGDTPVNRGIYLGFRVARVQSSRC
jgi:formylglycine-generating enzyme required for sulfatase activity